MRTGSCHLTKVISCLVNRDHNIVYNAAACEEKQKFNGRYLPKWTEEFKGLIVRAEDEQYAHCTVCGKDVKVAMSGVYDIKEHFKAKIHIRKSQERKRQLSMTSITRSQ